MLEVEYDPELLDWNEAIQAAYSLHGFRPGQARVIARPKRHNSGLQVGIKVGNLHKQANIFEMKTV